MDKLKYIYQCELGIVHFAEYFEYLRTVEQDMPPLLAGFARDEQRYALNSNSTLHDAWVSKFSLENRYAKSEVLESIATLNLLHSSHAFVIQLIYKGIVKAEFSPDFPGVSEHPVDLLVHEFTIVEPGIFQHFIEFDKGQWMCIGFRQFDFTPALSIPAPQP